MVIRGDERRMCPAFMLFSGIEMEIGIIYFTFKIRF
jgi:hypothetical protein